MPTELLYRTSPRVRTTDSCYNRVYSSYEYSKWVSPITISTCFVGACTYTDSGQCCHFAFKFRQQIVVRPRSQNTYDGAEWLVDCTTQGAVYCIVVAVDSLHQADKAY